MSINWEKESCGTLTYGGKTKQFCGLKYFTKIRQRSLHVEGKGVKGQTDKGFGSQARDAI